MVVPELSQLVGLYPTHHRALSLIVDYHGCTAAPLLFARSIPCMCMPKSPPTAILPQMIILSASLWIRMVQYSAAAISAIKCFRRRALSGAAPSTACSSLPCKDALLSTAGGAAAWPHDGCGIAKSPPPFAARRSGSVLTLVLACGIVCPVSLRAGFGSAARIYRMLGDVPIHRELDYMWSMRMPACCVVSSTSTINSSKADVLRATAAWRGMSQDPAPCPLKSLFASLAVSSCFRLACRSFGHF